MEAVSKGLRKMQQPSASGFLVTRSAKQLPADSVLALGAMMAQTQSFFPNQTLPPGTPEVWLRAWEELALKFGLDNFTEGLWKVVNESDFMPGPKAIREACGSFARAKNARAFDKQLRDEEADRRQHPEQYVRVSIVISEHLASRKTKNAPAK